MSETLKRCRVGRTHDDAIALVEYLYERNGSAASSSEAIAMALGMMKNLGSGHHVVDMARFRQARNHVKDGTSPEGKPCTGYRLNYRTSARGGEFTLIDPTGDLGHHADAAIESVRGWMVRESTHHTENQRQIETVERLGDHALARGDKIGYKLCARMSVEIEREGTVSPATMAEAQVWLASLR